MYLGCNLIMILIISVMYGFRVGLRWNGTDRKNLESARCGYASQLCWDFSHFRRVLITPLVKELLKRTSISDPLYSLLTWRELWEDGKIWLHMPATCLRGQLGQHEFAGIFSCIIPSGCLCHPRHSGIWY